MAGKTKGTLSRSECLHEKPALLLLRAEDRILGGFGDAELDDALGRNLNLLAGGRVAADAGFAIHEHQFAEARKSEGVLCVFVREVRDMIEDLGGLLFRDAIFFSDR